MNKHEITARVSNQKGRKSRFQTIKITYYTTLICG